MGQAFANGNLELLAPLYACSWPSFFAAYYLGRKSSCLFHVCREITMPMPLMFLVDGALVDGKKLSKHHMWIVVCKLLHQNFLEFS